MFDWVRDLFRNNPSNFVSKELESQLKDFLRDNPDASDMTKTLVRDLEARSLKEDGGGSASSPVSSP